MDTLFSVVTNWLSVASGLVSVIATLFSVYSAHRWQSQALRATEEQKLLAVLGSDDMATVGTYLDDQLGKFTVYDYVSNENVRKRVTKSLHRIQEFIGTPEETAESAKGELGATPSDPRSIAEVLRLSVPTELTPVVKLLTEGNLWNAMAVLRRQLEILLHAYGAKHNIPLRKAESTGRLLNVLVDNRLVDKEDAKKLGAAIAVANHAIHGSDITMSDATDAFTTAVSVWPKLGG